MRTLMIYLAGIATAWAALALYGRIPHADRERSQRYTDFEDDTAYLDARLSLEKSRA